MSDFETRNGGRSSGTQVLDQEPQARLQPPPAPATSNGDPHQVLRDGSMMTPQPMAPGLEDKPEDGSWLSRILRGLVRVEGQLPSGKSEAEKLPPVPSPNQEGAQVVGGADFNEPVNPHDIAMNGEELGEPEKALKLRLQMLPFLEKYGIHGPEAALQAGKFRGEDGQMWNGVNAEGRLLGVEKEAKEEGSFLERTGVSLEAGKVKGTIATGGTEKDPRFVIGGQTTNIGAGVTHVTQDGKVIKGGLSSGDGMEFRGERSVDAEGRSRGSLGLDIDMYSADVPMTGPASEPPAPAADGAPAPDVVSMLGDGQGAQTQPPQRGLTEMAAEQPEWYQDESFPGQLAPLMATLGKRQRERQEVNPFTGKRREQETDEHIAKVDARHDPVTGDW